VELRSTCLSRGGAQRRFASVALFFRAVGIGCAFGGRALRLSGYCVPRDIVLSRRGILDRWNLCCRDAAGGRVWRGPARPAVVPLRDTTSRICLVQPGGGRTPSATLRSDSGRRPPPASLRHHAALAEGLARATPAHLRLHRSQSGYRASELCGRDHPLAYIEPLTTKGAWLLDCWPMHHDSSPSTCSRDFTYRAPTWKKAQLSPTITTKSQISRSAVD